MMNVYVPVPLEKFELCQPVDDQQFDNIIDRLAGTPYGSNWQPVKVEIIQEDRGKKLLESDTPWLGPHALIFRQTVVQAMGSLLREFGELLPLQCDEAELSIFNVTRLLDALDESASSIVRFGSGRILNIEKYEFRRDIVKGNEIFKIPNLRASPTFIGDRFVELWKTAGLRGLDFKKVWSAQS